MAIKDAVDSMPDERTIEPESFANRKLIRPSLNRTDHNHASAPVAERRDRPERSFERNERNDRNGAGRKAPHLSKPTRKISIIRSKCRRELRWSSCSAMAKRSMASSSGTTRAA